MFSMTTRIHVSDLRGREITDFLLNCDDAKYQRWWRGTHLHLHMIKRRPGVVGSLVYMDELIGGHRVSIMGIILAAVPGKEIVWQSKWCVRLPIFLALQFEDDEQGVNISHTIRVGFAGIGALLDPIFRLWFSQDFQKAMDEHVRTEFPKLRDLLHGAQR